MPFNVDASLLNPRKGTLVNNSYVWKEVTPIWNPIDLNGKAEI